MAISASKVQVSFPASSGLVTLAEVKDQLSLFDDTTFDNYLNRLIIAATTHAGNFIGQALEAQEVTEYFKMWDNRFDLRDNHVDAIGSVTYYNRSNTSVTVSASDYILDTSSDRAAVVFTTGQTSELSADYGNPITVVYDSLHSTATDNQAIKQAVLIMVADMFAERESNPEGALTRSAHITAERLLAPYRRYHV